MDKAFNRYLLEQFFRGCFIQLFKLWAGINRAGQNEGVWLQNLAAVLCPYYYYTHRKKQFSSILQNCHVINISLRTFLSRDSFLIVHSSSCLFLSGSQVICHVITTLEHEVLWLNGMRNKHSHIPTSYSTFHCHHLNPDHPHSVTRGTGLVWLTWL